MLTPAERRGALVVVLLVLLGAARDLVRVRRAPPDHGVGRPVETRIDEAVEAPLRARPSPGPEPADSAGARLDLNRATERELDGLPGIGPVLAGRIVEHRRRHGAFRRIEDLAAVRGIGPRLLERLRDRVRAGAASDSIGRPVR